jgi:CDK inhibitor PHO81
VLFASYCGLSRSTPEGQLQRPNRTELDRRCTSIEGAVKFAKANNLLGVLLDATIVVRCGTAHSKESLANPAVQSQVPSLIDSIKENGLLLALFGVSAPKDPSLADVHEITTGVLVANAGNI